MATSPVRLCPGKVSYIERNIVTGATYRMACFLAVISLPTPRANLQVMRVSTPRTRRSLGVVYPPVRYPFFHERALVVRSRVPDLRALLHIVRVYPETRRKILLSYEVPALGLPDRMDGHLASPRQTGLAIERRTHRRASPRKVEVVEVIICSARRSSLSRVVRGREYAVDGFDLSAQTRGRGAKEMGPADVAEVLRAVLGQGTTTAVD